MKKKLFIFAFLFITFVPCAFFAQNSKEQSEKTESNEELSDLNNSDNDFNEFDFLFENSNDYVADSDNSNNSADDFNDLDSLFNDSEDISLKEEKSEKPSESPKKPDKPPFPINLFGTFSTEAVYLEKIYDREDSDDRKLGALLSYDFGISYRPSPNLTFKSIISLDFPQLSISLDSLYFDYILFNRLYLTAGKTSTSWGNSIIFDTNILDDIVTNEKTSPQGIAILTIPFGHGSFEGIVNYWGNAKEFKTEDLSYNAAIEYPFFGFSYKLFATKWANSTDKYVENAGKGALGFEITGDIKDFHLTAYGTARPSPDDWTSLYYANFVGGISNFKDKPQRHGAVCEYQFIYSDKDDSKTFDNQVALTAIWSHIFDSKFSPVLATKYNINKTAFSIVPSISVSDLIPYAKIYFSVPMIYGDISVDFGDDNNNKFTLTGIENKFSIWAGLYIKITVSY